MLSFGKSNKNNSKHGRVFGNGRVKLSLNKFWHNVVVDSQEYFIYICVSKLTEWSSETLNSHQNIMKKHNFNAGPSILARRSTMKMTAKAIIDFNGSGLVAAFDFAPHQGFRRRDGSKPTRFSARLLDIPENYKIIYHRRRRQHLLLRGARQLPRQESRLREYRRLGEESHEGGQALRRSGAAGVVRRPQFHLHSQGFRHSLRSGLRAYHLQQYDLRHRVPRGPRFARSPDRRHVVGHPFAVRST